MVFDSFFSILDPVFLPLVNLNPLFGVIVISAIASIIITLAHKYMTDQVVLKNARAEMKKLQQKMRQHKDNPKKMMEVQSKILEHNKSIMGQSFRPMLLTFIPIIIIFGWINIHLVYEPINPGEEFSTMVELKKGTVGDVLVVNTSLELLSNNTATINDARQAFFTFSGDAGLHNITYEHAGVRRMHEVLISDVEYIAPETKVSGDTPFKELKVIMDKQQILNLGPLHLNGFWCYIIFSIVFSLLFRKLMGVV